MSDSERTIQALLERGHRRPEPPDDVRARVLAAVEAEWNATRRKRPWPVFAAAAAVAVAILGGVLLQAGGEQFEVELAQTGSLVLDGARYTQGGSVLEVHPGSTMTAESASRVVVADGVELRLRAGTELSWAAPNQVSLAAGAIYLDSHGRSGFRVATSAGVVEDIGTRFMVTVAPDAVEVAMREGVTHIDTVHGRYVAGTHATDGDVLRVDAQGVQRQSEPIHAERWEWIHEAHPGYRESSVPLLLSRIAGDLGLALDYAAPGVRAAIETAQIEGDLGTLAPREALHIVLATNGLEQVEGPANRLVVGFETATKSE